jgi:pilus assembly protein TadC
MALKDKIGLKDETLLGIGLISMAASVLVGRFVSLEVSGFSISAFAEGLLSGVALVLIFYSLWKRRRA